MKNYTIFLKNQKKPSVLTLNELEQELQFIYLDQLTVLNSWELETIQQQVQDPATEATEKKYHSLIESSYIPKTSIRFISDEVGYGLFVEEDLPANIYVGEYVGQIRKNDDHGKLNNYLYRYPVLDSIGRNYVIDATCGNLLRFANHSSNYNLKVSYAYLNGFYHAIFISVRPIMRGEQLTYCYGKNYWYLRGLPAEL